MRDPKTAEALKPWYNWLCKRPCFHDEYLDVFNQDNVTLVDTEGRGIDRISGNVVVANGEEFELDLLIFATGFELSPYEEGSPIPVTGRDGRTLAEKWKEGATTLHGQHVHGFPNLMLSTTRQASWENNFPFPQDVVATHLAKLIRTRPGRRCRDLRGHGGGRGRLGPLPRGEELAVARAVEGVHAELLQPGGEAPTTSASCETAASAARSSSSATSSRHGGKRACPA